MKPITRKQNFWASSFIMLYVLSLKATYIKGKIGFRIQEMLFHSLEHIPRELVTSASVEGHFSKNIWTTQIVLDGNKKQRKKKNTKDSSEWVDKV